MKTIQLFSAISIALCLTSCQKEHSDDTDLRGSISLVIEVDMRINNIKGRVAAILADTLNVSLFSSGGSLITSYENVIDFPESLELSPDEYYLEVYSDNQDPAAWENPFVYGHSGNFLVEAGISQTLTVDCSINNSKVTVGYTQSVIDNFGSYETVVSNSQSSLTYGLGEVRAGYFSPETFTVVSSLTFLATDGTSI